MLDYLEFKSYQFIVRASVNPEVGGWEVSLKNDEDQEPVLLTLLQLEEITARCTEYVFSQADIELEDEEEVEVVEEAAVETEVEVVADTEAVAEFVTDAAHDANSAAQLDLVDPQLVS